MKNGFFRVNFEQPLEISFKRFKMKFIYFLASIVLLSSCSKTSEFAIPTSAYFKIPANKNLSSDTTIVIDSIPTNFAYSFQANETSPGNIKQLLFQQVNFTIINNSYNQTFNFVDTIKVSLVTGENTSNLIATDTLHAITANSTALLLPSGTDASQLINSKFYSLTVKLISIDSISEDIQIQANTLFYVKAKTD